MGCTVGEDWLALLSAREERFMDIAMSVDVLQLRAGSWSVWGCRRLHSIAATLFGSQCLFVCFPVEFIQQKYNPAACYFLASYALNYTLTRLTSSIKCLFKILTISGGALCKVGLLGKGHAEDVKSTSSFFFNFQFLHNIEASLTLKETKGLGSNFLWRQG